MNSSILKIKNQIKSNAIFASLIKSNTQNQANVQNIDSKTGLHTDDSFKEEEAKAIKSVNSNQNIQSFVEIYMDIDNFSLFNSDFGYSAGDDTILKIGEAILNNIKNSDFAARVGGEEIAILTTKLQGENNKDNSKQNLLPEIIRKSIQNQQLSTGRTVTVSIGVAEYIRDESLQEFKLRLHTAEKIAKKNGKNRIVQSLIINDKEIYEDWTNNKTYSVTRNSDNEIKTVTEITNG